MLRETAVLFCRASQARWTGKTAQLCLPALLFQSRHKCSSAALRQLSRPQSVGVPPLRHGVCALSTGPTATPFADPSPAASPHSPAGSPFDGAAAGPSHVHRHGGKAGKNIFHAAPNVGSGRPGESGSANPFKSWEHINHSWLILMCAGCLCAGLLAGYFVEVDETKLKPKFSKLAVVDSAAKQYEFRPDLAATIIRVAFVLAARRAGFAADTVDESCAVVDGLTDAAGVLNYITTTYGASMEDAVSLAAIAAVKYLHGPYETILDEWQWGRNDTDAAPARKVPTDAAHTQFSIPTVLHGLGDLSDEECVALMACHSVGEFHEYVSGVDAATHVGSRYSLSNAYYTFLVDHRRTKFSPLEVARTEDNKDVKVLPSSLVCTYASRKNSGPAARQRAAGAKKRLCVFTKAELDVMLDAKRWYPIVERFSQDEAAWRQCFQSAFGKMINAHFKRLRVYTEPDSVA